MTAEDAVWFVVVQRPLQARPPILISAPPRGWTTRPALRWTLNCSTARTGWAQPARAAPVEEETQQENSMSMNLVPGAVPATYEHEEPPHRCGRCANPYTNGNPNCPNAPRPK